MKNDINNKKIKLFTDRSFDGLCSAIVMKRSYPDVDISYTDQSNIDYEINKFINDGNIKNYDKVFIQTFILSDATRFMINYANEYFYNTKTKRKHIDYTGYLEDKYQQFRAYEHSNFINTNYYKSFSHFDGCWEINRINTNECTTSMLWDHLRDFRININPGWSHIGVDIIDDFVNYIIIHDNYNIENDHYVDSCKLYKLYSTLESSTFVNLVYEYLTKNKDAKKFSLLEDETINNIINSYPTCNITNLINKIYIDSDNKKYSIFINDHMTIDINEIVDSATKNDDINFIIIYNSYNKKMYIKASHEDTIHMPTPNIKYIMKKYDCNKYTVLK